MEEHISDIQLRTLFNGQNSPKGGLSAALLHIFRCGSCLELFVDFYTHPARDAQYDEMFDRLERSPPSSPIKDAVELTWKK